MNKPEIKDDEIDLMELAAVLWRRAVFILGITAICGIVTFCCSRFLIKPTYQADVLMYVNNKNSSSSYTSTTELSGAQSLVKSYSVLLKSRTTLNEVRNRVGLDYELEKLEKMISVASVNSTENFRITVKSNSAREAQRIANTIAEVLPQVISSVIEGSSIKVVDEAILNEKKVAPSNTKNALIGAFLGFVVAAAWVLIRYFMDDTIHSQNELAELYDIPVLAVIPDLTAKGSNAYGYGAPRKSKGGMNNEQ